MARRTHLKDHLRETHLFAGRAVVALVCVALLMIAAVLRLVYLQIISHDHFITLPENNRVNIVPIPPTRGLIYDRKGVLIAQNTPSFSLDIVPEQVKDLDDTLSGLGELIAVDDEDLDQFNKRLSQRHPYESIPLRLRLSEEEVARFAGNRYRFPGVDIHARLSRDYPLGALAVHAVGYVGRINEAELQELDSSNYRGSTYVGKTGVEKFYEAALHGNVGYQNEETNAAGRGLRVLERRLPTPGQNLYLTIDLDLQQVAELSLNGRRGAVVAIAPKTGEVLALASIPGYEPGIQGIAGLDRPATVQPRAQRPVSAGLDGQTAGGAGWPRIPRSDTAQQHLLPRLVLTAGRFPSLPRLEKGRPRHGRRAARHHAIVRRVFLRPRPHPRHRPHEELPRPFRPRPQDQRRFARRIQRTDAIARMEARGAQAGLVPGRNADNRHRSGLHAGDAAAARRRHRRPRQSRRPHAATHRARPPAARQRPAGDAAAGASRQGAGGGPGQLGHGDFGDAGRGARAGRHRAGREPRHHLSYGWQDRHRPGVWPQANSEIQGERGRRAPARSRLVSRIRAGGRRGVRGGGGGGNRRQRQRRGGAGGARGVGPLLRQQAGNDRWPLITPLPASPTAATAAAAGSAASTSPSRCWRG